MPAKPNRDLNLKNRQSPNDPAKDPENRLNKQSDLYAENHNMKCMIKKLIQRNVDLQKIVDENQYFQKYYGLQHTSAIDNTLNHKEPPKQYLILNELQKNYILGLMDGETKKSEKLLYTINGETGWKKEDCESFVDWFLASNSSSVIADEEKEEESEEEIEKFKIGENVLVNIPNLIPMGTKVIHNNKAGLIKDFTTINIGGDISDGYVYWIKCRGIEGTIDATREEFTIVEKPDNIEKNWHEGRITGLYMNKDFYAVHVKGLIKAAPIKFGAGNIKRKIQIRPPERTNSKVHNPALNQYKILRETRANDKPKNGRFVKSFKKDEIVNVVDILERRTNGAVWTLGKLENDLWICLQMQSRNKVWARRIGVKRTSSSEVFSYKIVKTVQGKDAPRNGSYVNTFYPEEIVHVTGTTEVVLKNSKLTLGKLESGVWIALHSKRPATAYAELIPKISKRKPNLFSESAQNKINEEFEAMKNYKKQIKELSLKIDYHKNEKSNFLTQIQRLEQDLQTSRTLERQAEQTLCIVQEDLNKLQNENENLKSTVKTFKAKRDLTKEEEHIRLKYDSLGETLKLLSQEAKLLEERRKETQVELDKVEELQCGLCIEKPRDYVFQPCHHVYACTDCGKTQTRCPICRIALKGSFQMILS